MSDLLFQQLSTVNNNAQPLPPTIASASVISPSTFLTVITGTTSIGVINPFVTGAHMLVFIFTNANPAAFSIGGSGNIVNAAQPLQNIPVFLIFNPQTGLYSIHA